ncbi:MAG: hypothetical protein ACJ8KX_04380 [Chthoniobacterales bacterium]
MKRAVPLVVSVFQVVAALWMYRFLNSGGWLTHRPWDLHDLNSLNLIPVIFEPVAVLSVIAYWMRRTARLHRLLMILAVVQVLILTGYLVVFIGFVLTYRPRMM